MFFFNHFIIMKVGKNMKITEFKVLLCVSSEKDTRNVMS